MEATSKSLVEMRQYLHSVDWTHPEIWALSDGYGAPGYVPAQGYDWSGVRDSTEDALRRMYVKAKEINS